MPVDGYVMTDGRKVEPAATLPGVLLAAADRERTLCETCRLSRGAARLEVRAPNRTASDLAGEGVEEPLIRSSSVMNGGGEYGMRHLGEPSGVGGLRAPVTSVFAAS